MPRSLTVRSPRISLLVALVLVVSVSLVVVDDASAAVTCNGEIATIVGTPGDDVLTGTPGPDVIAGLGGNDRIFGVAGDDVICGGAGQDVIFGGGGDDWIDGESGNDYDPDFVWGPDFQPQFGGIDGLHGGPGNDTIFGGGGVDFLYGDGDDDWMDGGTQNDRLFGALGNDTIFGGDAQDLVKGGGGNDTLQGGDGLDKVFGGTGGGDYCLWGPRFGNCEAPSTHVVLDGAPAGLAEAVEGLAAWLDDPKANPQPAMPAGLARHLKGVNDRLITTPVEFDATWSSEVIGGQRVAVVYQPFWVPNRQGEDVLFWVDDGGGWELVAARVDRYRARGSAWYGNGPRHVMVIGSDARPGEDVARQNADSLHLLSAYGDGGAIVGFPRHSWVDVTYPIPSLPGIPGPLPPGSDDKASWTMLRYGPAKTVSVFESNTGLPIDGYILTQFGGGKSPGAGFIEMVDALAGLFIDLPYPIRPADTPGFPEGEQTLDGTRALILARERKGTYGEPPVVISDLMRQYHGSLIIEAALIQVQEDGWLAIPGLLDILDIFSSTNLTPTSLLQLAGQAFQLDPGEVTAALVPSKSDPRDENGISCSDPAPNLYCTDGVVWGTSDHPGNPGYAPGIGVPYGSAASLFADLADNARIG